MLSVLLMGTLAHAGSSTAATVHELPNGLTVILEEQHRTDQVALYLKYRVGSRDERDGERGCAHLFEHLMFEGSKHVGQNMFDTWLTAAGGSNNAYTSEDETVYHMAFPAGAAELALFLESDRMGFLDAGLTLDNLANQQGVVLQEREQGYAEPHGRDFDALNRLMYPPGHPYHVPVIGTVADIQGFSIEGVQDFWRRHYRPRNAVLVLVGDFDSAEVLARVTHWFADVPDTGAPEARVTEPQPARTAAQGMLTDEVEDRTVWLAWPTVPLRHADEPALDLASQILDGGRGTRLDDALYDKTGLTTDFGAWSTMSELSGAFIVYATSPKAPLKKIVSVVDRELRTLASKPPTPQEVDRARKSMLSGYHDALEMPESRASTLLACYELWGRPNCVEDEIARYEAVTPEDIRRVVAEYLVPEARVSLSVVPEGDGGSLPGATPVELP